MTTKQPIKCYSYIRFSTVEQRAGDSLRRQIQFSEEYARKHGYALDTSLNLRDLGLSGYKGDNCSRGALGRFIGLVEKGQIPKGSILLVESLDRLSREDITEALPRFLDLLNSGITVVTLGDNERVYNKASIAKSPMDLMMSLVVMSRAHEESETKSLRGKAMWDNKRKSRKPMTSVCPAWLRYDKQHQQYVQIKDRVALVKRMFSMAHRGVGQHSICNQFNTEGIKTWGRSKAWNESYVGQIISGKAVLGEYALRKMVNGKPTPTGEVINNYFPSVIDTRTYYAVQATRKKNVRYRGRYSPKCSNLFTGVAKCGVCGDSMVYHQIFNKTGGVNWTYLVCNSSKRGLGCKERTWNYKTFETQFVEFIRELDFAKISSGTDLTSISKLQSDVATAEAEVADIQTQLTRLVNIIAESPNPPKTIVNAIAKLEEDRAIKETAVATATEQLDSEQSQINAFIRSNGDLQDIITACGDVNKRFRIQQEIRDKIKRIDIFSNERAYVVTFANNLQRVALPDESDYQTFRRLFESGAIKVDLDQERLETICYTHKTPAPAVRRTAQARNRSRAPGMYESVSKFRHAPPALFDELKKPVHYQKNATAWFFDKVGSGSRWLLSNMAGKMPIYWPLDKIDKNLWNSSEQLYQSSKYGSEVSCLPANAKSKKNPYVRQRIRADNTPRGAKATQKCAENKGLVRKGWADAETEVRIQAMLWVLELKLYWNQSTFGEKLMATGNLPIVEISTKDDFWGCKEVSAGCLVGLNVLGKLLMDVRSRMDMVKRGQFTYPNGWLLP